MSEAGLHPLESILRLCAASAPEPWYPRLFAQQEGVDRTALGRCLEHLWLSGLIERADGGPDKGPAISLTPEGHRVLLDPEAMECLRTGRPVSVHDRAAIVRQTLTGRIRPGVTRFLLALNILIFLYGYTLARRGGVDSAFLQGSPLPPPVAMILVKTGALTPEHLVEGEWWRLLSAGFVHIGYLHLLMNMICLFMAGRFIEQMWGHLRYLIIYLVALLGGCCLGMAHTPVLLAGASGAICGLLAAEAMWFLFNRRYLPRALVRQARTNFIVNLVLLVFISSFKDVSGWGHFGGAAAGALAALLLHLHRFGPPLWRWLALAGFAPMIWYGHYALVHGRATDPHWEGIERRVLDDQLTVPVTQALTEANKVYRDDALPILEKHPTRRDPEGIESVLEKLTQQRQSLQALDAKLARFGPLYRSSAVKKQERLRDQIAAQVGLLDAATDALRKSTKWPPVSEREQRDFEVRYLRFTDSRLSEAMEVYRQRVRPLLEADPAQRGPSSLPAAQAALADQISLVKDLGQELLTRGRYQDETAEAARKAALEYAAACLQLLTFCQERLKDGMKDTRSLQAGLEKREQEVEKEHRQWRELVE